MMNVCISVGVCGYYGWVLLTVAPRYLKLNLHLKILTSSVRNIQHGNFDIKSQHQGDTIVIDIIS